MFTILLFSGIAVGVISSFFGVGGGVLIMPVLYGEFPELPAQVAIASSLALIALNSATNVYNFWRSGKKVDLKFCALIMVFMALGTLVGTKIAIYMNERYLKLFLAWALLLVSLKSLLSREQKRQSTDFSFEFNFKNNLIAIFTSLLSGLVAGLTGLGGGAILVPAFISFLKMPYKWVPLYSNVGMMVGTFSGFLLFLFYDKPELTFNSKFFTNTQVGFVNFGLVILLYFGSFFGSRIGIYFTGKSSDRLTKYLFVCLLLFFSVRLFYKNW